MNKTLILFIVIACSSMAKAQQKPSKEETVAFMDRTMKAVIGVEGIPGLITSASFDYNKCDYTRTYRHGGKKKTEYSSIQWENFKNITYSEQFYLGSILSITVNFSTKFNYSEQYDFGNFENKNEMTDHFSIIIAKEKISSFVKACYRLAELAKEENKDPFSN
jgi:hypothetical protein